MQSSDEIDDHFILGFVHTSVRHRSVFVFGRCYRWNSQSAGWERGLDSHIAVSVPLIIDGEAHQYHAIAEFLRLRAKERETDAKIDRLERAQMDAAAHAAANRLPEHDPLVAAATSPTSPTAWVLANKHGVVLTRFWGLRPRARAAKMFEIAFFDSQAEAEGVHDAMGLRGTVRPQLVNRRTLEPVT